MGAFGFNKNDKDVKRQQRADKRNARQEKRRTWAKNRRARQESFDYGSSALTVIFGVLLLGALIATLNSGEIPTFGSFLEFLRSCPTFDLNVLAVEEIATADWGSFQAIATVINLFIGIYNALAFIVVAIGNSVVVILWFMRWLFL